MKTDVIIVGAELDGQVAALRLLEHGYNVRIFARGGGSLHYAPGGIHLLGYSKEQDGEPLISPLDSMASLAPRHPYQVIGPERVGKALDWFFAASGEMDQHFRANGGNTTTLTPAGFGLPTYAPFHLQAGFEALRGKRIAVAQFRGHRDFPAGLIATELAKLEFSVDRIVVEPPGGRAENVALAKAFDRLDDPRAFFQDTAKLLPLGTELVLFPALLGLENHQQVSEAAATMGFACLEVPTLPPSVPGLRLTRAFERRLLSGGAAIHFGAQVTGTGTGDDRVAAVTDQQERSFDAAAFILASGGVLMGGLEVDSTGAVREPTFGLKVHQTAPLTAERVDHTLDALHQAGIEINQQLRPRRNGSHAHDNLFVTGSTLGHWNPPQEASAEGVSIATGWAAAEAAHTYLENQ